MLKTHIRKVCMARGLTMSQLAKEAGVSAGALSNWANGKTKPHSRTVPRLAAALGLEVDALIRMLGVGP